MPNWNQRHIIIIPASLQAQANAEAIKWDPDAGGGETFQSAKLSSDGGVTHTHYWCSTLIDADYYPPNQGGKNAVAVLDAFYATGHYIGYRILHANANNDSLTQGQVETVALFPYRWEVVGPGELTEIVLDDQGMIRHDEGGPP